jgi:hypothetical protein
MAMLESERSRIASDMHDDIGADLTQLSIWSNTLESSPNKGPQCPGTYHQIHIRSSSKNGPDYLGAQFIS